MNLGPRLEYESVGIYKSAAGLVKILRVSTLDSCTFPLGLYQTEATTGGSRTHRLTKQPTTLPDPFIRCGCEKSASQRLKDWLSIIGALYHDANIAQGNA